MDAVPIVRRAAALRPYPRAGPRSGVPRIHFPILSVRVQSAATTSNSRTQDGTPGSSSGPPQSNRFPGVVHVDWDKSPYGGETLPLQFQRPRSDPRSSCPNNRKLSASAQATITVLEVRSITLSVGTLVAFAEQSQRRESSTTQLQTSPSPKPDTPNSATESPESYWPHPTNPWKGESSRPIANRPVSGELRPCVISIASDQFIGKAQYDNSGETGRCPH